MRYLLNSPQSLVSWRLHDLETFRTQDFYIKIYSHSFSALTSVPQAAALNQTVKPG